MTIDSRELVQLIKKNYGSIYNSHGKGKSQIGGMKVKTFVDRVFNNRVLDVYLKYMGFKTLNSATIVPLALLLGKDAMDKYMIVQTGGGKTMKINIPMFDHPVIGTYLKIIGLTATGLTIDTMVPIGALMIIYDLYNRSEQVGGGSSIWGSSVPSTFLQRLSFTLNGQNPPPNPSGSVSLSENNNNPFLNCGAGQCRVNDYSTMANKSPIMTNIRGFKTPTSTYVPDKQVPINPWYGEQGLANIPEIPSSMAGGGENPFNYIKDPISNKIVNIHGSHGRKVLKNYIKYNN